MHPARIAELLEPFLRSPATPHSELNNTCHSEPEAAAASLQSPCHSEPAQAGEGPVVLVPANDQRLTTSDLESISTYIDILLRWNARINLTAIRDPEDIITRHFGESLFAARHLFPSASSVTPVSSVVKAFDLANDQRRFLACPERGEGTSDRVADLGSGAGFPGLPIKLWAPHIALTLIESNHKKAAFLSEVTRALTLTNVNIQNTRAESLAPTTFDVVTLRAVERFAAILPIAGTLVAPTGRLALLIGAAQQDDACSTLPHLTWQPPLPVPESRSRILLIAQAPAATPSAQATLGTK
jgi:16S rRNA (guanine527-N7)-methyltransferase